MFHLEKLKAEDWVLQRKTIFQTFKDKITQLN